MTTSSIILRLEYLVKDRSKRHPAEFFEEAIELAIDKLLVGPPTVVNGDNVLGLAIKELGDGDETGGYLLYRIAQLRSLTQQHPDDFDFEVDNSELDVLMCLLKITWNGLDAIDGPFTLCYSIDQGDFKKKSVPDRNDLFEWELLVKRLSSGDKVTYVLLFVMEQGPGDRPIGDCEQAKAKLADSRENSPNRKLAIRQAQKKCLIECAKSR